MTTQTDDTLFDPEPDDSISINTSIDPPDNTEAESAELPGTIQQTPGATTIPPGGDEVKAQT